MARVILLKGFTEDVPVFIIMCIDPCGKIVACPGMRTCVTSLAPFSSYMYVVVLPWTATTMLTARPCKCGGSMEQGPRLSMATGNRVSVSVCGESISRTGRP